MSGAALKSGDISLAAIPWASDRVFDFARSRQTIQPFPCFNFNLAGASSLARIDHGRRKVMDNFEDRHIYENWFAMKIYESKVTETANDLARTFVQS